MLNPRQEKFARLFVSGRPAGRAYEEAGYKARGNSAEVEAGKTLRMPHVAAFVADLRKAAGARSDMTLDDAIAFLVEIIQTPVGEVSPNDRLAQEHQSATEHAAEKIKMPEKLGAFRELAKILGWYQPQQIKVEGDALTALLGEIRQRKP